jgi:cytochrome c
MNSMEVNKIFAAILTAGITFMLAGLIGRTLVSPHFPEQAAIAIGEPPPAAAPATGVPALEPVSPLLAAANVDNGRVLAQRQCGACHSFDQGGRAGIGPNLYGIMGAKYAHAEGFNYSAALRGKQGDWTYEEMNAWLARPATWAPGTRMAFAGIGSTQQRADLIAYLRTLAATPMPLPDPAAAPPPTPVAAAAPAPAQPPSLATLIANADVAAGETVARRLCAICHTFTAGGANGVGPNLYGVVGGPYIHVSSFNYSPAFRAKQGALWTYEELDAWLKAPLTYIPGTRMAFIGIADAQQRANVIAWMRTLAENPVPLPAP